MTIDDRDPFEENKPSFRRGLRYGPPSRSVYARGKHSRPRHGGMRTALEKGSARMTTHIVPIKSLISQR